MQSIARYSIVQSGEQRVRHGMRSVLLHSHVVFCRRRHHRRILKYTYCIAFIDIDIFDIGTEMCSVCRGWLTQ
jgi:hypothetical protein